MKIAKLISKFRQLNNYLNDKGVPIWMVRDPNTLEGSVSLSLVCLSTALVTAGIVGKWSGHLGGIDIANALQFFYASCTLYFGHSWVHKDDGKDDAPEPTKAPKADNPDDPDKA